MCIISGSRVSRLQNDQPIAYAQRGRLEPRFSGSLIALPQIRELSQREYYRPSAQGKFYCQLVPERRLVAQMTKGSNQVRNCGIHDEAEDGQDLLEQLRAPTRNYEEPVPLARTWCVIRLCGPENE